MTSKRRYAIIILVLLAEVITPPDAFSWILVFIPLYVLYEVSIFISHRAVKERARKQAQKEMDI
jgi:sec-independent protein translocase protein TatC